MRRAHEIGNINYGGHALRKSLCLPHEGT